MTLRLFKTAFFAVAIAAGLTAFSPIASATTFSPLSTEQFTDASSLIVEGTVLRTWTELDARGLVWTRAEVQVTRTLKGHAATESVIVDSMGGTYGDTTLDVPGMAEFSVGEETLLFLFHDGRSDRLVPVSKFLGKYTLRRAPGERRKYAQAWHPKVGHTFDHRFLPHPAAEARVYVDDLEDRISARVQAGWDGKPIPGISEQALTEINTAERRLPR